MAGDGQATVTFRASYDGGSPITSYTVTSNPDNISATGVSSPIVVKGLRNDVEYTFTVKANNSIGASAPSLPSNVIVPMAIAEKDTKIDINTTTSFILNKDIVGAEGRKYDVPAYWNDKFFSNKSTSYNHDLAKISMQLSASAYSRSKGTGFGFINMDLEKLGFSPERIISYNYNVDDANTVGFTLALKSINLDGMPYNLLLIGIRGTPGNIEWDGNFDIGINTTVHRGFQAATSDLLNKLEKYVEKYVNQSITTKVLIFGHSRGAAVANLVAKNLSAGFKVNHLLLASKNDIYAYTFATPNVASDAKQTEALYGNIFNFVHYDDFVPILPLDKWNYGRYGITLKFPRVNTAIAKMDSEIRKITGKKFMGYNAPYAVRKFEENLGNIAPSVHAFYTDYKEVALHICLSDGQMASIGIVNIFNVDENDTKIEFMEDTLSVTKCLVNGKEVVFSDYVAENKIDTKLPLVADYNSVLINVSIKSISEENKTVDFYAPVFAGKEYRFARPVSNYAASFEEHLQRFHNVKPIFSCNCVLNYLYGELDGKATLPFAGPVTFGEVAYQLLNQTLVYAEII